MRTLIFFIVAFLALTALAVESKRVVCYYNSRSAYRPGRGKFQVEDFKPEYCTHAIYAFVGLDGDDVKVLDPFQDLADNNGRNGYKRFNDLRNLKPELKTMISMGGRNESSSKYSAMASDPTTRARFVNNVLTFLQKHDFNGFDLVWLFPGQLGGNTSDFKNYVSLIKELSETLTPQGFLLSAAVSAPESSASISYDIPELSKYLDFINLMTYDIHGAWESQTGLNAPLYSSSGSPKKFTIEAAVNYWLNKGADPEKLNLGIAFYGRSFTLADTTDNDIGAVSIGPGKAGPYTQEPGILGYNEICELRKKEWWTVKVSNEKDFVPYAFNDDQWIGYDDIWSVRMKARHVKKMKLGGAMVWSIDTDDFTGYFGIEYPLVSWLKWEIEWNLSFLI